MRTIKQVDMIIIAIQNATLGLTDEEINSIGMAIDKQATAGNQMTKQSMTLNAIRLFKQRLIEIDKYEPCTPEEIDVSERVKTNRQAKFGTKARKLKG